MCDLKQTNKHKSSNLSFEIPPSLSLTSLSDTKNQLMWQSAGSISLPELVLALFRGELIKCFGLLFAQKGLMVILEALIVFVGLPA